MNPEHVVTVWHLSMLELSDFDNIHPLIAAGQKHSPVDLVSVSVNTRKFKEVLHTFNN